MQEHHDPQIARAEIDGCKQYAQRSRKDTLHQHAKGSAGQEVGQVGRAKERPDSRQAFQTPARLVPKCSSRVWAMTPGRETPPPRPP